MKDRLKKFYRDHEDDILLAGILVTGMTVTVAAQGITTKRALDGLRIDRVDLDKSKERVRITYKNGDQDYYHGKPVQN
jgi:hypothetical protein